MTPKLGVTFSCQNFLTPSFGDPKLKHCVLASRVSIPTPLWAGGRDARGAGRSRGGGAVGAAHTRVSLPSACGRSGPGVGAAARTGQSSSRRRVLRPWPVWGQRRGSAAGEPRGWGAPPSMGRLCAVCQTLGCQACTYRRTALRAPRCREPWPGSDPMKTVGAQFSVLRRTCSVSELCIISLHANK